MVAHDTTRASCYQTAAVQPATAEIADPAEDSTVAHPPGFRERRRVNWVFLGLMYGFFYMSRYNFSAISVAIGDLFGWSNKQYGSISAAGKITYAFAVLFNGPIADRIGGKRAILIGSIGAAAFNFLFGLCFIFLAHPAVTKNHALVSPAVLQHGMTVTTMIALFSTLWACNHYFQSFGALSIVKINAAWFHVRERGIFAGLFGIMIQSGRQLAFVISPFILAVGLPWQWCFWIPAAILVGMYFVNKKYVEDSPEKAGYEFNTADETKDEAAQKATFGYVVKKVFASPSMWLIAVSSMCIGMVRNGIDDWWPRYIDTVFNIAVKDQNKFMPYQIAAWGMPLAAILGGIAAGNASDRLFGSRRAPVICLAFVGQIFCLVALTQGLHSPYIGALLMVMIAFFITSAHALVGGAASMDFGGKKAVATAAGLFDGAQYFAGAMMALIMGALFDAYRNPKAPGAEYDIWPLAMLPFAIIGAILIARLWNVVPGRVTLLSDVDRSRGLFVLHRLERAVLFGWALWSGMLGVLNLILPQRIAVELLGHAVPASSVVPLQLAFGARLGLAVLALAGASMARPPRVVVRALVVGLVACIAGPVFSFLAQGTSAADFASYHTLLFIDGAVVVLLLALGVVRANLTQLGDVPVPARRAEPDEPPPHRAFLARGRHSPHARREIVSRWPRWPPAAVAAARSGGTCRSRSGARRLARPR